MSPFARIPTPAEARHDPTHAPWWALVAAVEAVRRERTAETVAARDRARAALLRELGAAEDRRP